MTLLIIHSTNLTSTEQWQYCLIAERNQQEVPSVSLKHNYKEAHRQL